MTITIEVLDVMGLSSLECIFKIASRAAHMKSGSILEVVGDSPNFEKHIRAWCEGTGRLLLFAQTDEDNKKIVHIRF
jgi:tRNA 2-thiouridine synthesizing protein A